MTAGESLLVSQVRKLWLREGTSVAGQWWGLCASTAGGEGLIPGRGTTIPQTTPGTEAFWLQSPSCWHHINAPQQRKLMFPTVWPGVSLCPFSSEIFTVLPVTAPVVLPSPGFSCCFCFLTLFFLFGHITKACRISRGWTQSSAVRIWSPNHWTAREFLLSPFLGTIFSVLCINRLLF